VSAARPSSRHLVDPELLPWVDQWVVPELSLATLGQFRALLRPGPVPASLLAETKLQSHAAPSLHGAPEVEVVVIRPTPSADASDAEMATAPLPAVLYLHGGGYIAGSARDDEAAHRALAARLHCVWVSVSYRLAPEVPWPGALDDGQAAWDWLHLMAAELGIDPTRTGLAGASAGGGLAAGLALRLRDMGRPSPAFLHLVYPMLDDRTCTRADPHPHAGGFVWTTSNNAWAWRAWLGTPPGSADVSDQAAPGRAQDLQGLPPSYIATGALDLFVDEDIAFAQRLLRAGVPTELRVFPGAVHGFDLHPTARLASEARRCHESALWRLLQSSG